MRSFSGRNGVVDGRVGVVVGQFLQLPKLLISIVRQNRERGDNRISLPTICFTKPELTKASA